MTTKHPRLMVTLDSPIFHWVKEMAQKEGVSLSMRVRDFLREIYEQYEERYWAKTGEKRLKTFRAKSAVSHAKAWK